MKSCHPGNARRENRGQTPIRQIVPIVVMVLALSLCSGCGQDNPSVRDIAATLPPTPMTALTTAVSTPTESPAQAKGPLSLHERVMAEQGRNTGASPSNRPAITTSTDPSEPSVPQFDAGLPPPEASSPQPESGLLSAGTVSTDAVTAVVLTKGQTPLRGVWGGTAEQLALFLTGACPAPCFTVPTSTLAEYYLRYSGEAGLRADLLWAQMIHETGYGMYGGDVFPEQNNYAGLGATGNVPGVAFATAEAGVMAHVAHMVAYVYVSSPVWWANSITDPRFDLVAPRGAASVLADLNGRWAVPGYSYGESIEEIARLINALHR